MEKYWKVNVDVRWETTATVIADNEDEACFIAQDEIGERYLIIDTATNKYVDFTSIIGYEPEEIE